MSRTTRYPVAVEFGDCDPAGIVFYPNFLRWIDAASRHFFTVCGIPSWRETEQTLGVLGTPLVDVQARFLKPASYGDRLDVATTVSEWRQRSFVMLHSVERGDDVLVEATEVRIFARRVQGEAFRIESVAIPDEVRKLCA
ncbi:MAG TPA: acyl-CoA thioesterase [Casimicrobiaceae bacterium]|nr:acyl-CoA thioesterase [Casimicrobiaceae bacterium]